MTRPALITLACAVTLLPATALATPPTASEKCASDVERAAGRLARCKLNADSGFARTGDAGKQATALARCTTSFQADFGKAASRYGAACPMTELAGAFDAFVGQCTSDTAAAAAGATLPDDAILLASCTANLSTCSADLATCTANLGGAQGDLVACQADLATCNASPGKLLKTGQTTSFGTGSDGAQMRGLPQVYTDNGDGTITDNETGLMWEKKSDDGSIHYRFNTYTWTTGTTAADGTVFTTFLATLNAGSGFAGHTDWRLPNRRELDSIVNLGNLNPAVSAAFDSNCNPGCTVTACNCTVVDNYWSSSTCTDFTLDAWAVDFSDGNIIGTLKLNDYYARAVRGGW